MLSIVIPYMIILYLYIYVYIYIYIQYACTFLCQLFVGDDSEAVVFRLCRASALVIAVVQKRCSEMGAFGVRSEEVGLLGSDWGAFQRHVATTTHHACVSDIGQLLLMSVLRLFRSMLREFL
jgi:hypothetical protein